MPAHPHEEPDDLEDLLQDLRVRVVRIGESGAPPAAAQSENLIERLPLDAPAETRAPPRDTSANPHAAATTSPSALPPPAFAPRTAAPAAAVSSPAEPESKATRRPVTLGRIFFVLIAVLVYLGWQMPTERYITPKRGLGYALGIIGGSLMLLLLLYSLRKRYMWLRILGPTVRWFRIHMILGILGPLCILYHANFSTGAANSNVALFAMLIVAGSGLIGRYIYAHIHNGLYGRKLQLSELRAGADNLRSLSGGVDFLPELVTRLESAERRLLDSGPRWPLLGFAKPLVVAVAAILMRWRLHFFVRRALRADVLLATEHERWHAIACAYVDRRLAASRRVAGFEGYERLFSLWHALHIPLIFMMIIAAVIHVIAVHVY